MQEQFGYAYDAAWNLNVRTNNALAQKFNVNTLNELTTATNSGTLTVAGTTTEGDSNYVSSGVFSVTVNGQSASVYFDGTFAAPGFTPTNGNNTFTAIAQDTYGRGDTNTSTSYLPSSISYTYDLNGNLLSDGTRHFTYDDENQLVSVWVTNAWREDCVYDGLMRKRVERDYGWNGSWLETNEVHFIYDGNLMIQERGQNNLPQVTYTRGNDLSGSLQGAGGIGGLLARTDMGLWTVGSGQATAFYQADGNGNITCMVNTNGAILARYEYDPFGNMLSMSGPLAGANRYRFSSKEWNDNAGLYFYGFRFYDPNLQRWPNRDPIQENGGYNLYTFISNVSVNTIDAFGLCDTIPNLLGSVPQKPIDLPPYLLWPQPPSPFPPFDQKPATFKQFLNAAEKGFWNLYSNDLLNMAENGIRSTTGYDLNLHNENLGLNDASGKHGNGFGFTGNGIDWKSKNGNFEVKASVDKVKLQDYKVHNVGVSCSFDYHF